MISETSHNPAEVIFNFSSHEIDDDEKSLLCEGLKFLIPPKPLDYVDHMLLFELLIRDINKIDTPNDDKEFIKSRPLNGIKVLVFLEKHIKNKHLCGPDRNYYYCCKSNIRVNNLIVGSRNMINVSKI